MKTKRITSLLFALVIVAQLTVLVRAQGPMCNVSGIITDLGNTPAPLGTTITITPVNVPGRAVHTVAIKATVGDNGAISFSVFKGAQVLIQGPVPGYSYPGRKVQIPNADTYDFGALIDVPLQPLTFGNPMTQPGDLIVGGTNGAPQRAAKGANNTVWGVDGNGVVGYKPDPAGGGGSAITLREVDNSPSISGTTTFEFNQAAGLVLTDQGSHVTRLNLSNVPYSALSLAGGIVNSDVNAAANIAQSKVANLVNDLAGKSAVGHTHVLADVTNVGSAASKNYPASGNAASGEVVMGSDTRLADSRTPTAHATSHKHGGSDEVATATPAANAIPKADSGGKLAANWIPDLSSTYEPANANIQAHIASTSNPHSVTKAQVGLGSVLNAAQLVAANNLSDLANAATARSNLGVAIGSQVQAYSARLGEVASIGSALQQIRVNAGGTALEYFTPSGGGAVSSVSNSDSTLIISPTTGAVVASLNLGQSNTWTAAQAVKVSNATTSATDALFTIGHNSSGTPAAGFGSGLKFQLQSSTTADRDAGQIGVKWTDATDGSRNSAFSVYLAYNGNALAEMVRVSPGRLEVAHPFGFLLGAGIYNNGVWADGGNALSLGANGVTFARVVTDGGYVVNNDTGLTRQQAGVYEVNAGSAGTSGVLLLRGMTFASLPSSPVAGMHATVTDSTTTTYGATISGGGSNTVHAFFNGSNWIVD